MAFVTPAGYNPSDLETSPRSKATAVFPPPNSVTIPGQLSEMVNNAVAGPSGTTYTNTASSSRRTSREELPISPSSAPPNPSVISVTHPPEFIHTHHPRRGSLTPLGLNVISPMPPVQMTYGPGNPPHSPVRSIGFTPTQAYQDSFSGDQWRRGSGASSSSTLTQSRPLQFGHGSSASASGSGSGGGRERRRSSFAPVYPPGFNPERRRSSLTPANPTLAPASPTRLHAKGVLSRPGSSDGYGGGSGLHTRHHTTHGTRPHTAVRNQNAGAAAAGEARRGSMPQMHHGGWTGPRWNPSLPTQRGSVGEEPLPDESFKFGSIGTNPSGPSTPGPETEPAPIHQQKAIEISPSQRSNRVRMDAFQEAEAAEAERQRRAFISATFGDDGKRARERLSIGGPMAQAPLSPTRRPSLMLWEKLGMAAAAKVIEPDVAASSAPTLVLPKAMSHGDFGPRRGSLPIAIPVSPHGMSPTRRERRADDSRLPDSDDAFGEEDEDEDLHEYPVGYDRDRLGPIRPAPPLLPLSDPGPRLLPSTLALQRASHLLSARRLQADPLPHPLPPSLHPPIPVDVTEFDIDFILAGSSAQLGRTKRPSNAQTNTSPDAPMYDIAPFASSAPAPALRLGADDEDTFAKFVGKFDDEYGGRRGEWTFHAKPPSPTSGPESRQQDGSLRAVWESPGAGAFEIYANGDVRSARNGTTWRTTRKGICEYEIEHVNRPSGFFERLTHSTSGGPRQSYVLASKAVHREHGGIKTATSSSSSNTFSPTGVSFAASSSGGSPSSENRSRPIKDRLRVSISEATRTLRLDSTDSSTTATPSNSKLSSSLPSGAMLTPKKKRRPSRDKEDDGSRTDQTSSSSSTMPRILRVRSRDPGDEDKKGKDKDKESSKDKAGFFKKSLMAPFKNTHFIAQYEEKKAQREERERERQQAHSWGGNTTHPGFIHPSGKNTPAPSYQPSSPQGRISSSNTHTSTNAGGSSARTSSSDDPKFAFSGLGSDSTSTRQSNGSLTHQVLSREGKWWAEVPEDAVAMIIPDQGDIPGVGGPDGNGNGNGNGIGTHHETSTLGSSSEVSVEPRQALLVWYVPFNGDRSPTQAQSQSSAQGSRSVGSRLQPETSTESQQPPPSPSSSLPKFQKLLRRRTSKDKELAKISSSNRSSDVEQQQQHQQTSTSLGQAPKHPLPFRSFRIVARIVDLDGLRSITNDPNEDSSTRNKSRLISSSPTTTYGSVPAPSPASAQRPTARSVDSAIPLNKKPPLTTTKTDETTHTSSTGVTAATGVSQGSTAPTSTILAGRTISTVIAVCHSRSQGVEFVLEGLDRLGYCTGESAWGPTGYEEWRGTGLSEKGRELLELLWAGCTGVMGLNG